MARLREPKPDGCTGLVVLPERSATGALIHAQNWDWLAECAETGDRARASAAMTDPTFSPSPKPAALRDRVQCGGHRDLGQLSRKRPRLQAERHSAAAHPPEGARAAASRTRAMRVVATTPKACSNNMILSWTQGSRNPGIKPVSLMISKYFLSRRPGLEARFVRRRAPRASRTRRSCRAASRSKGGWPEVWRANLEIRGASRVLARIGAFRAMHLAQLDKRARKFPWGDVLRADVPVRVEATCRKFAHLSFGRRRATGQDGDPRGTRRAACRRCASRHQSAHRRRSLHDQHRYVGRVAAQARPQAGHRQGADARDHGVAVPAALRL